MGEFFSADMPIYRMTKEEVEKRKLLVDEAKKLLAKIEKIAKSPRLVKKELINELNQVDEKLTTWQKKRNSEADKLRKELNNKKAKTKLKIRK